MRMVLIGIFSAILILGALAVQDAKSTGEDLMDQFRCEKFNEAGMSALKLKLIENCNLDKPFSFSGGGGLGGSGYAYCCHKKK